MWQRGGIMPLEAHLCTDLWNATAQLLSKISVAANGWSTRASFEPFQRVGEPDWSCHLYFFFFVLSSWVAQNNWEGKTCKNRLLLKNVGNGVEKGFELVHRGTLTLSSCNARAGLKGLCTAVCLFVCCHRPFSVFVQLPAFKFTSRTAAFIERLKGYFSFILAANSCLWVLGMTAPLLLSSSKLDPGQL